MPLEPGTRLGPYEINGPLGSGGMGDVYRARDSRLHREVALKVLPADVAGDESRLERFQREARSAAKVAHPNVASVHDVGREGDISYIVTELVDGVSLRTMLREGPIAPTRAKRYAAQIAHGMAAAHDLGIVHRDLKPENIMIGTDDRVRIVDFGLAKPAPPFAAATASGATVTLQTEPGFVLGTSGYMAPEQLQGKELDGRSDIFAFGVVLHEMLAGARPFAGESMADVASAILRADPEPLPATVPPMLQAIVVRCLEKQPSKRFQNAHDLAFALESCPSGTMTVEPAKIASNRFAWRTVAAAAGAALALGAAIAIFVAPARPDMARYRFTPFATSTDPESSACWSRDGRSVAYIDRLSDIGQVFVRHLDSPTPVQLTHSGQDCSAPFWAPDGSRVYYVAGNALWQVGVAGGEPHRAFEGVSAADISPDGKALALYRESRSAAVTGRSIWISSPPGAEPHELNPSTPLTTGLFSPNYLRFSPDGSRILAAVAGGAAGPQLWLARYGGERPHRIFENALRQAGDVPSLCWMPDGRRAIMAVRAGPASQRQLWMADIDRQRMAPLTPGNAAESDPAVSPDGTRLVFTSGEPDYDAVDIPLDGQPMRDLVATRIAEQAPAWSPTGPEFAYVTRRSGTPEVWLKSARDGWERPLVTARDFPNETVRDFYGPEFSPDGARVAYGYRSTTSGPFLWISPRSGGTPIRVASGQSPEYSPAWSPDGSSIAFTTIVDGRNRVRIVRLGSSEAADEVPPSVCVNAPRWSPTRDVVSCLTFEGAVRIFDRKTKAFETVSVAGARSHVWSRDGGVIYATTRNQLIEYDLRTKRARTISTLPAGVFFYSWVGLRLSLAPDGRSVATTVTRDSSDLWMLQGFEPRRSWPWLTAR